MLQIWSLQGRGGYMGMYACGLDPKMQSMGQCPVIFCVQSTSLLYTFVFLSLSLSRFLSTLATSASFSLLPLFLCLVPVLLYPLSQFFPLHTQPLFYIGIFRISRASNVSCWPSASLYLSLSLFKFIALSIGSFMQQGCFPSTLKALVPISREIGSSSNIGNFGN